MGQDISSSNTWMSRGRYASFIRQRIVVNSNDSNPGNRRFNTVVWKDIGVSLIASPFDFNASCPMTSLLSSCIPYHRAVNNLKTSQYLTAPTNNSTTIPTSTHSSPFLSLSTKQNRTLLTSHGHIIHTSHICSDLYSPHVLSDTLIGLCA